MTGSEAQRCTVVGAEKLPAEAFGAGPATYRFPLPLSKLAAGSYMLRIEASRPGAPTVKRETMFDVQ